MYKAHLWLEATQLFPPARQGSANLEHTSDANLSRVLCLSSISTVVYLSTPLCSTSGTQFLLFGGGTAATNPFHCLLPAHPAWCWARREDKAEAGRWQMTLRGCWHGWSNIPAKSQPQAGSFAMSFAMQAGHGIAQELSGASHFCFGIVPARSCSNTLMIQAQHEWRGWTGNFAACQEGLCQKIHRQQHTCTTFSFTDTFPKQIYLLGMKFSSLWSGVRLGWLGLFVESHQLSSGEFSSIKSNLCIPHCKINSLLPAYTQDSNLWSSSGETKENIFLLFPITGWSFLL